MLNTGIVVAKTIKGNKYTNALSNPLDCGLLLMTPENNNVIHVSHANTALFENNKNDVRAYPTPHHTTTKG
jgi:hypothetical protein